MDNSIVFKKTAKGMDEAENRTHKVDIRQRAALLAVNGTDSVGQIIQRFHGLEQLAELFAKLEADGFIERVVVRRTSATPTRAGGFGQVIRAIAAMIHEMLGPDGDMVTERLEQLSDSLKDPATVMQFLEQRRELFQEIAGKEKASQFFHQVRKMLGLDAGVK